MLYRENVIPIRSDVGPELYDPSSAASAAPAMRRGDRNYRAYHRHDQSGVIEGCSIFGEKVDYFFTGRPSYHLPTETGVDFPLYPINTPTFFGGGAAVVQSPLQKRVEALEAVSLSSARVIGRLEAKIDALVSAISSAGVEVDHDDLTGGPVDIATLPQLTGQALAVALNRLADDETVLDGKEAAFVGSLLGSVDGSVRAAAARALAFGSPKIAADVINAALQNEHNRAVAAVMRGALRATA